MTGTETQPVVFIIDDDATVRDAISDLLRSIGLAAQSFGSTQEFLQGKRPDTPGCIVLDIRLPGASGLEFQNTLADANIRLPIIFITGYGDIPMSVRAIKSGAIEFLTKPLREQELIDAVHVGIKRDRARREQEKVGIERAFQFADIARTRSPAARRGRTSEQTDRGTTRVERGNREDPSQPDHAQDAGEVPG